MHKEVLSSIEGVSLFPVIAIALFMVIFSCILIYVWRIDRQRVELMASIPILENQELTPQNTQQNEADTIAR